MGNFISTEGHQRKKEIFKVYNFLAFWLYGFVAIELFVLFQPFVQVWAGTSNMIDNLTITIIVIEYYFTGMRVAVANFKSACGIFQADKYIGIVQAVVNLVLSIILAKWIGLPGVYLGTVAQGVVDLVWRPRIVYHQVFGESAREYYVQWLKYLALILCMAGICYVAAGFIFVKITLVRVVIAGVVVMLLVNGAFLLLFRKTEEFQFLWGKMQTLFGKYSAKILGRR